MEHTLKKLTKEDNKELKLLAYGRPHVFVEDYKGQVMCVGLENGADVTGGTAVTGAAMGDKNGYELSFVATEKTFARAYEGTITDFSVTLGS